MDGSTSFATEAEPAPKPAATSPRKSAPYIFHGETTSLCETCLRRVPAKVIVEGSDVFYLKRFRDDGGQKTLGSDDYGYEGLRNVLLTRLLKATDIRYTMRYVGVSQQCKGDLKAGCRAAVDVLVDASYTITNVHGKAVRPDKRDQNQLVLEWDGRRWLFLSGM
jgi:hypothetical protein